MLHSLLKIYCDHRLRCKQSNDHLSCCSTVARFLPDPGGACDPFALDQGGKEFSDIRYQQLGCIMRGKVPALWHFSPVHDIVGALCKTAD